MQVLNCEKNCVKIVHGASVLQCVEKYVHSFGIDVHQTLLCLSFLSYLLTIVVQLWSLEQWLGAPALEDKINLENRGIDQWSIHELIHHVWPSIRLNIKLIEKIQPVCTVLKPGLNQSCYCILFFKLSIILCWLGHGEKFFL